jgi:CRISPR-associated protein Csm1
VQVFLQAKLLGIEAFVSTAAGDLDSLGGRCLYASLLTETLPRALLDHLSLSHQLIGSTGGGQFLLMLTTESVPAAHGYMTEATRALARISGGTMRLAWAVTENLGDWSDIRKRLSEQLNRWRGLGAIDTEGLFEPFTREEQTSEDPFAALFQAIPASLSVRFDLNQPLLLAPENVELPLARHAAPRRDGLPAGTATLAAKASGRKAWGILRADIDQFGPRLRRAQTIDESLECSLFFRNFFAGEVQVLCAQAEFWQKVTILYTGGDDFAIAGAWDALIPFAREMERIFKQTAEEFLKDMPGPEGKTISMGLALAPAASAPAVVYAGAGRQLEIAKCARNDGIALLGRSLDWKQLAEASEIKDSMIRLVEEFGCSPSYLGELAGLYRESDRVLPARTASRTRNERQSRPWRLHGRLNRMLEGPDNRRDYIKARDRMISEFVQRNQAQLRLRPSGRVALEWARLSMET